MTLVLWAFIVIIGALAVAAVLLWIDKAELKSEVFDLKVSNRQLLGDLHDERVANRQLTEAAERQRFFDPDRTQLFDQDA